MDAKILWLAKRLNDLAADIEKLSISEKKALIERLDSISDTATNELYNILNEFMKWD